MAPQLSVIVPTYNRREILLKTLEAYKRQTAADEMLEVIVVDDGSTDGTGEAVAQAALSSPFPIRLLRQDNRGLATARNLGIRSAKGELILFGDDDIIPTPTFVAEHAAWHRKYPAPSVAILGHVAWSPDVNPTPFMEWLGRDGVLFGFGHLSPGSEVEFAVFCNTSVKKSFLLEHGMFDEDFRGYGWEDVELGYRLMKKGFRLLYNSDAIGHHYKHMSFADVCRRAELVCAASALLETKEAGRHMKERESRGEALSWKRKLKRAVAKLVAPFLVPLTPLLDTQIRLPREVYQTLYMYHVLPKAQARFNSSKPQHEHAKGI